MTSGAALAHDRYERIAIVTRREREYHYPELPGTSRDLSNVLGEHFRKETDLPVSHIPNAKNSTAFRPHARESGTVQSHLSRGALHEKHEQVILVPFWGRGGIRPPPVAFLDTHCHLGVPACRFTNPERGQQVGKSFCRPAANAPRGFLHQIPRAGHRGEYLGLN